MGSFSTSSVVNYELATTRRVDGRFDRYYDPSTEQFLSVDPDLAETGQPYAFTADDPLNSTDPLGLSGDATADIAYNRAHHDVCGNGRGERRCQGIGHDIVKKLDQVRHVGAEVGHQIKSHPLATAGLVLGTVALAIPGAEGAGAELDAASVAAFTDDEALSTESVLQTVKTASGLGAASIDANSCVQGHAVSSCAGAVLGGFSTAVPGDELDGFAAWVVGSVRYATGG